MPVLKELYKGRYEAEFKDTNHRYRVRNIIKDTKFDHKIGVSTICGLIDKPFLKEWAAKMTSESFKELVVDYATTDKKITKMGLHQLSLQAKKAHHKKAQLGKDVGTIAHDWIKEETDSILNNGGEIKAPSTALDEIAALQTQVNDLKAKMKRLDSEDDVKEAESKIQEHEEAIKVTVENVKLAKGCVEAWRRWVKDYKVEFIKSEFIVYSETLDYCGTVDVLFKSHKLNKTFVGDYKTSEPEKIRNRKTFAIIGQKPYPEHFVQVSGYDYAHNEETGFEPDGYAILYLPKDGGSHFFIREKVEEDRRGWSNLVKAYKWVNELRKAGK